MLDPASHVRRPSLRVTASVSGRMFHVLLIFIAVGVDSDADSAALLIKELEGKDVEEVIAEGRGKLASVPAGGAVAAGGAAGAAAAGGAAPAEEEKVEEEEDEDMGFSLFD